MSAADVIRLCNCLYYANFPLHSSCREPDMHPFLLTNFHCVLPDVFPPDPLQDAFSVSRVGRVDLGGISRHPAVIYIDWREALPPKVT